MKTLFTLLLVCQVLLNMAQPLRITFQTAPAKNCLNTGSATALPDGGTGTYTFLWGNGETGATINDLFSGVYSVTVNDGMEMVSDSVFIPIWDTPLLDTSILFTGTTGFRVFSLDAMPDGGYLVSGADGYIQPFPAYSGLWRETLLKVSRQGDIEWQYLENTLYNWRTPNAACGLENGDAIQIVYVEPSADRIKHHGVDGTLKRSFYPETQLSLIDVTAVTGGYIVLANNSADTKLFRYSLTDSLMWERTYGGSDADWGNALQKTSDGNIVVVGTSKSNNGDVGENAGGLDAWLFMVNEEGDLLWSGVFGGTENDFALNVAAVDGGLFATINSNSTNGDFASNINVPSQWFYGMDNGGNVLWSKPDTSMYVTGMYSSHDGGILACGAKFGTPGWQIIKMKNTGLLEWKQTFSDGYYPKGIGVLADERILVAQDSYYVNAKLKWFTGPMQPNLNASYHTLNCQGDSLEIDITDPTCNGCTYSWDDGFNEPVRNANALLAPVFYVTVTDENGCSESGKIELPPPTPFNAEITISNSVICQNDRMDWLEVTSSGGKEPFGFTWDDGSQGRYFFNQPAGAYAVTATDGNGCISTDSLDVPEGESFDIEFEIVQPIAGQNNGSIGAIPIGGTPPFTFVWNTNDTSGTISNLSAGSYSANAYDALGCHAFEFVQLENITASILTGLNAVVHVFPNPVGDEINIHFTINEAMELSIEIYDAIGQQATVLAHQLFTPGNHQLKTITTDWPSGILFLQIKSEGQSAFKRLIKIN